jgi:hypothetical protein
MHHRIRDSKKLDKYEYYYKMSTYVLNTLPSYKYYVSGHYPSSCFYLKHRPVCISEHKVSENEFCLQVNPALLGPNDRASP